VIRQGHLIAVVVRAFLIGCAVLLVVGCAGTSSEAPKEQGHSPEATASEEARCAVPQPIDRKEKGWLTNNVPGCPKGGPLSGTDSSDSLDGLDGDDEIRGLGAKDDLIGGLGSDVIYGGPGNDFMKGGTYKSPYDRHPVKSKDVLYGGPGNDTLFDWDGGDDVFYAGDGDDSHLDSGEGEDVIYGGDGGDSLNGTGDGQRDKLYCGKGKDGYSAEKIDYVDSSCEEKLVQEGGTGGA
jgi:Ca2+-binding RTX toxin-like protein